MEPNESTGLSSYFHHQTVHQSSANPNAAAAAAASNVVPNNGNFPNAGNSNPATAAGGAAASHMVYHGSMPSAAVSSPMETVKRKRGRPRKYGTPEQAAAAKRMSSVASASNSLPKKRDQVALRGGGGGQGGGGSSYSLQETHFAGIGDAGQGFTPHIINVLAGEDVGNKIMTFMQQSKREICIISASGAVSSASLLQPSTSGGSVTYEGRFDIISLSGSYVNNGHGGKTGGLSVCLASTDGQIIGGGVGGPLTAAGQIQVIVGTFVVDTKRSITGGARNDTPAQVGVSPMPGVGFQSGMNSSHQNIGGSQFMTQPPRGMQPTPLQWRDDAGQAMHLSPQNGGFDHLGE